MRNLSTNEEHAWLYCSNYSIFCWIGIEMIFYEEFCIVRVPSKTKLVSWGLFWQDRMVE